jgi:hypothetical protein
VESGGSYTFSCERFASALAGLLADSGIEPPGDAELLGRESCPMSSIKSLFRSTIHQEETTMNWKEQLDKAVAAVKEAATSENARDIAGKAKAAAMGLVDKVKTGAVDAADAFVEANRDPSALSVRFLNADLTVLSPAEGISVTRPDAATLVVDDGSGNGLVINAGADPAFVAETIGTVAKLGDNTFDLGQEDGVNVVVTKF